MSDESNEPTDADPPVPRTPPPSANEGQSAYLPPSWEVPDTVPDDIEANYAGYGWRVIGYLIDALIVGVALGVVSRLAGLGVYGGVTLGFVVRALYAGFLIAFWRGQTVGMRAVKLVCVDGQTRAPISLAQSLIRAFTAEIIAAASLLGALFGVVQLLDLLWPAWDKKNQTLHDKVGRTVVLR